MKSGAVRLRPRVGTPQGCLKCSLADVLERGSTAARSAGLSNNLCVHRSTADESLAHQLT